MNKEFHVPGIVFFLGVIGAFVGIGGIAAIIYGFSQEVDPPLFLGAGALAFSALYFAAANVVKHVALSAHYAQRTAELLEKMVAQPTATE